MVVLLNDRIETEAEHNPFSELLKELREIRLLIERQSSSSFSSSSHDPCSEKQAKIDLSPTSLPPNEPRADVESPTSGTAVLLDALERLKTIPSANHAKTDDDSDKTKGRGSSPTTRQAQSQLNRKQEYPCNSASIEDIFTCASDHPHTPEPPRFNSDPLPSDQGSQLSLQIDHTLKYENHGKHPHWVVSCRIQGKGKECVHAAVFGYALGGQAFLHNWFNWKRVGNAVLLDTIVPCKQGARDICPKVAFFLTQGWKWITSSNNMRSNTDDPPFLAAQLDKYKEYASITWTLRHPTLESRQESLILDFERCTSGSDSQSQPLDLSESRKDQSEASKLHKPSYASQPESASSVVAPSSSSRGNADQAHSQPPTQARRKGDEKARMKSIGSIPMHQSDSLVLDFQRTTFKVKEGPGDRARKVGRNYFFTGAEPRKFASQVNIRWDRSSIDYLNEGGAWRRSSGSVAHSQPQLLNSKPGRSWNFPRSNSENTIGVLEVKFLLKKGWAWDTGTGSPRLGEEERYENSEMGHSFIIPISADLFADRSHFQVTKSIRRCFAGCCADAQLTPPPESAQQSLSEPSSKSSLAATPKLPASSAATIPRIRKRDIVGDGAYLLTSLAVKQLLK